MKEMTSQKKKLLKEGTNTFFLFCWSMKNSNKNKLFFHMKNLTLPLFVRSHS